MIHHLSIAAREPEHVAGVLAEFMGGAAVPFPPNPGSFFALQLDQHGSGVEVYPAGTELHPGGMRRRRLRRDSAGGRGFGPTHFALSVKTDADAVEAIAKREGWQCFRWNRGPFHVIEVWVENEADDRDPAARIRSRISRLHPTRQDPGGDGLGADPGPAPTPGVISIRRRSGTDRSLPFCCVGNIFLCLHWSGHAPQHPQRDREFSWLTGWRRARA